MPVWESESSSSQQAVFRFEYHRRRLVRKRRGAGEADGSDLWTWSGAPIPHSNLVVYN